MPERRISARALRGRGRNAKRIGTWVRETVRRVLVLYNRSLLAEVVAHLLRKKPGLEVLQGLATEQTAAAQVRELKPDVVIVDSQDGGLNPDEVVLSP